MKESRPGRRQWLAGGAALAALSALPACTLMADDSRTGLRTRPSSRPRDALPTSSEGAAESLDLAGLIRDQAPAYLLLGEVHDARLQHRLRLKGLQDLVRSGLADRFNLALAFEQLDASAQAVVDRLQGGWNAHEARQPERARALAEAAGFNFKGWDWSLYEGYFQWALAQGWRIVAANLGSAQAMQLARDHNVPPPPAALAWRAEDQQALRAEIQAGHCNALPEAALAPMVRAQMARDACLARALYDARQLAARSARPPLVILLAGNGHVRRDLGVPRHLQVLDAGARICSVALLELDDTSPVPPDVFDKVIRTRPQEREDPCLAFMEQMKKSRHQGPGIAQ